MKVRSLFALPAVMAAVWTVAPAVTPMNAQVRDNAGFRRFSIPRNDDGSGPAVTLPFTVNFFGRLRSTVWVNNNGNITFDGPLATYTPFGLVGVHSEIIAPFFADVDTRGLRSALVTYGDDVINGRRAFGANYINVGYFASHDDKLNSFQVVLIERPDTGDANFDLEFNYARITWETGDASGGVNGFGGVPAAVGWSNGSGDPGTSFELPGSRVPGSFLDSGSHALIRNRQSSTSVGRYVYRARGGVILPGLTVSTGCPLPNATLGSPYRFAFTAIGSQPPYLWSALADPGATLPPGLGFGQDGVLSGTPASAGDYAFTAIVKATDEDGETTVSRRCTLTVDPPRISITSACPLPSGIVGTRYQTRLSATGGPGPFQFALLDSDVPGLALSQDGVLSGEPVFPGTYRILIKASTKTDGALPATKLCSLEITPASMTFAPNTCPLPTGTGGVPYAIRLDELVRGGIPPYRFTAEGSLPTGLALTPSGFVTGTPSVPEYWPFTLRVTDSRGVTGTLGCGISIVFPEVRIMSACPLPAGRTGVSYSQRLTATGGNGPYNWTLIGTLPAGLRLSQDGQISGTPLTAGPNLFRLVAVDGRGQPGSTGCSLTVNRGEFAIASCPLQTGYQNESYSQLLSAAGGVEPYSWTALSNLPTGLSLSPSGFLSGTPRTPGTTPVSLRVTDQSGQSVSANCNLTVLPPALRFTSACPLPVARFATDYSATLTAAGGVEPYNFTALTALPAGLSLHSNGVVDGRASALGGFPFLLRVTDSRNSSTIAECAVAVSLPDLPDVRISGLPSTVGPATSGVRANVELAAPYAVQIDGRVSLTATPDTNSASGLVNRPDPIVRFNNGQTSAPFSIPAGQRQAAVTLSSTGTVAGTIGLQVTDLSAQEINLGAIATPGITRVPRQVPTLTDACYGQNSDGFFVQVTGVSTTRELQRADISFSAGGGSNVFSVDLSGAATEFFSGDESVRTGGAFTLRAAFRYDGNAANLGSATVTVTNSIGTTGSRTAQRCQ
jgi:Nidogen-like/Putative Ig domain